MRDHKNVYELASSSSRCKILMNCHETVLDFHYSFTTTKKQDGDISVLYKPRESDTTCVKITSVSIGLVAMDTGEY